MHFLRRLSLFLTTGLLKFGLLGLAVVFALSSVLGTSDQLKKSLDQSKIYDQVVDGALDQAAQNTQPGQGSLPLDQPEIRAAAKAALPPKTVQDSGDKVVDGLYGWLDGHTKSPQFRIDLTEPRDKFIQGVADYAGARLEGLPACTRQQNLELARADIDPFTVPCRPPLDIAAEKQRLIDDMRGNKEFLGNPVISGNDLSGPNGQAFGNNRAPFIFQWIKRLPIILMAADIVFGTAVIWLADSRRLGIKKVGTTLLGSGLLLIISTLILTYFLGGATKPGGVLGKLIKLPDGNLQSSFLAVFSSLANAINAKMVLAAIAYAILGSIMLLSLRLTRNKTNI